MAENVQTLVLCVMCPAHRPRVPLGMLSEHVANRHTGYKPFKCLICNSFSCNTQQVYQMHLNVHHPGQAQTQPQYHRDPVREAYHNLIRSMIVASTVGVDITQALAGPAPNVAEAMEVDGAGAGAAGEEAVEGGEVEVGVEDANVGNPGEPDDGDQAGPSSRGQAEKEEDVRPLSMRGLDYSAIFNAEVDGVGNRRITRATHNRLQD